MKKLFLKKDAAVPSVIEQILSAKDSTIVLVIPRNAVVASSLDNFHTIRTEADSAQKTIFIETVDNRVLAFAKAAKIEAANPLFAGPRRSLSDIVISENNTPEADETEGGKDEEEEEEGLNERIQERFSAQKARWTLRRTMLFSGVVVLLLVAGIGAVRLLPRADIQIIAKKVPWEYADTITIASQIFSDTKNIQKTYPASEQKRITKKATGMVTLFNEYSSAPQKLVASTRLETPDKRIYRLDEGVVIPGAKIEAGKIIPSSVTVAVTANKPGGEYNIGPVEKFVIPGFRESRLPQYDGFYGKSDLPMSGGFDGEIWYPSDEDFALAEKDIEEQLRAALEVFIRTNIPDEFVIIENEIQYELMRKEIMEEHPQEKEFALFAEAAMSMPAYREADAIDALTKKAQSELGDGYALKEYSLDVSASSADFEKALLVLTTTFSGTFTRAIDTKNFRERAAGKEEIDLRALVFSLPGVESARISLWPIWVSRVPENQDKIRISID